MLFGHILYTWRNELLLSARRMGCEESFVFTPFCLAAVFLLHWISTISTDLTVNGTRRNCVQLFEMPTLFGRGCCRNKQPRDAAELID